MTFPVDLPIGPWRIPAHPVFESLGYFLGFRAYLALRSRWSDPISTDTRWTVIAAAAVGALLGSRALAWAQHAMDPGMNAALAWSSGKTIVGGLLGGQVAVEIAKRFARESRSTGDLFAAPLAVGIAVGRVGCFLAGLTDQTYGTATALPWGMDLGDGVRRHPAALYEIVALGAIAVWVLRARHDEARRDGDLFRGFMVFYLAFRVALEFVKPGPRPYLGLSAIQIASLAGLAYHAPHVPRLLGLGGRRV